MEPKDPTFSELRKFCVLTAAAKLHPDDTPPLVVAARIDLQVRIGLLWEALQRDPVQFTELRQMYKAAR
jgi:hypothetical protein